jgi:hypothetical protein
MLWFDLRVTHVASNIAMLHDVLKTTHDVRPESGMRPIELGCCCCLSQGCAVATATKFASAVCKDGAKIPALAAFSTLGGKHLKNSERDSQLH